MSTHCYIFFKVQHKYGYYVRPVTNFVEFRYTVVSRPDTTLAEADFFICNLAVLNLAQFHFSCLSSTCPTHDLLNQGSVKPSRSKTCKIYRMHTHKFSLEAGAAAGAEEGAG
jgi:hypothetical protein